MARALLCDCNIIIAGRVLPDAVLNKNTMNSSLPSSEAIKRRIIELEVEHRDLDLAIQALVEAQTHEDLQVRRMKKRKLQLKDHITLLKMQLVPDIPA